MSKQVLLIEDEPNIIEAISFILSRDGWTVKTHSNGADAVELVKQRQPDVLILDVMLPGKSGYDILRELRDDPISAGVPVTVQCFEGMIHSFFSLAHMIPGAAGAVTMAVDALRRAHGEG